MTRLKKKVGLIAVFLKILSLSLMSLPAPAVNPHDVREVAYLYTNEGICVDQLKYLKNMIY